MDPHARATRTGIALLFEITRINGFATKGCAVVCHSPPDVPSKEWKFATTDRSREGGPVALEGGPLQPLSITPMTAGSRWPATHPAPTGTTGRRADAGDGGDVNNETEDKAQPRYMQDPAKKPSAPGFLLYEEAVRIPADAPVQGR
ncbi:MAG: hypothetical protein MZV63_58525 [Marinilabiliales bacterium]|nr:hypothetical protein [Marinilabiliales bacterium]